MNPEFFEEHTRAGDIEMELTITRTVRENPLHQHVLHYSFKVGPAIVVTAVDELVKTRNVEWG